MRDLPSALDLAAAKCRPPAHIDHFAIIFYADNPIEAVTKSQVVASLDLEVADLKSERPEERGEPGRQSLSQHIRTFVFQRTYNVERQDVR